MSCPGATGRELLPVNRCDPPVFECVLGEPGTDVRGFGAGRNHRGCVGESLDGDLVVVRLAQRRAGTVVVGVFCAVGERLAAGGERTVGGAGLLVEAGGGRGNVDGEPVPEARGFRVGSNMVTARLLALAGTLVQARAGEMLWPPNLAETYFVSN